MTTPTLLNHRHEAVRRDSAADGAKIRPLQAHSQLVRRRGGGLISAPRNLRPSSSETGNGSKILTKLLLNVNIQRSVGPVQVVMSPENTVGDLIKSAIDIYGKEKRRPLLTETDHRCFKLHYSQFCLESLKPEEKLITLGSRNFFMCRKPKNAANSSSSEEAKKAALLTFPFTKLMDLLL